MRIIVTGGAGFIGSAVIRRLIGATDWRVINVDKLTYAGNLHSLDAVAENPRYRFVQADICDGAAIGALFASAQPDAILHLAAESHVDRSIDGAAPFIDTNIGGTFTLLEQALQYWRGLAPAAQARFRFQHISTDEVYGSLGTTGLFTENTPYRPNSPYSASKAASDHLVRAWHHTYGLPVLITNCSNNYGPFHFPEKLIPLLIVRALRGQRLPVYGRGENVRDWLHVEDHVEALQMVLERGRPGEAYNIGARNEWRNIELVRKLCALLDEALPGSPHRPHEKLIEFVDDRPGHDLRYAIDPSKIECELGWRPRVAPEEGLRRTVRWFLDNQAWWQPILDGSYRGERMGIAALSTGTPNG